MPRATTTANDNVISVVPKILKISIANIGCIGSTPVSIDIDNIVVLVGPNNSGKSTILKIYECIMGKGKIDQGDIHLESYDNENPPIVEVESLIDGSDHLSVGEHFLITDDRGKFIRERWVFDENGIGKRQGRNNNTQNWMENGPLGADNVAKAKRPIPIRINAFDSPEKQALEINKLIKEILIAKIKNIQNENGENLYDKLTLTLKDFQKTIKDESESEITQITDELSVYLNQIFSNHKFVFEAGEENIVDDQFLFFKNSQLKINGQDGYKASVDKQGSGSRRTILRSILKYQNDKQRQGNRPFILLIDEPELCLHPSAIREACDVLYDLANSEGWQIMITTHSPQFIDLSKDNTTIVRVERGSDEQIHSTTLFRPTSAQLDDNDKQNLKLLNVFDPYVAEFFFGGKIVIVEGDTEYSVFKYIINKEGYKNIHVIRARGKSTIVSLMKILNHFGTTYFVIHDTDELTCIRDGKEITNPAWTVNESILINRSTTTRLLACKITFEVAFFGTIPGKDKPYNAISIIKTSQDMYAKVKSMLDYTINSNALLPENMIERSDIEQLKQFLIS